MGTLCVCVHACLRVHTYIYMWSELNGFLIMGLYLIGLKYCRLCAQIMRK